MFSVKVIILYIINLKSLKILNKISISNYIYNYINNTTIYIYIYKSLPGILINIRGKKILKEGILYKSSN